MSSLDYLDLCRLCLVKDRVGISIFEDEGDARQVFLKIASCLPVKVSREDKLPKKICDDCMYKLELFYQFWNTTANAEKQLLQWLDDVDMQDKQGYVTEVLNPSLMKQEQQASENRLDENVLQVGTHQNNMGMGMMDNMGLGMPIIISTTNQPMTSVSMDTSGSSVQTIQAVPGTSTQSTHDQISQNQVTNVHHNVDEDSDDDEENESDDECDADDGLPVKEENEDDPNNRTVEPTTFVNVSLPCDEAGPSGLQQQKITEMPEMAMPQIANADNKTGKKKKKSKKEDNIPEKHSMSRLELKKLIFKSIGTQQKVIKEIEFFKSQEKSSTSRKKKKTKTLTMNVPLGNILSNINPIKTEVISEDLSSNEQEEQIKEDEIQVNKHEHEETEIKFEEFDPDNIEEFDPDNQYEEFEPENQFEEFDPDGQFEEFDPDVDQEKDEINYEETDIQFEEIIIPSEEIIDETEDVLNQSEVIVSKNLKKRKRKPSKPREPKKKSDFLCTICGAVFQKKIVLQSHFTRKHSELYNFTCEVCGKKFKVRGDLTTHMRLHSEPAAVCDVCGRTYKNSRYLYLHQRYAHFTTAFPCNVCKRFMATQENLDQHIQLHHSHKERVICDECGKSYSSRDTLKRHIRYVHNKNCTYECEVCGKKFVRRSELRQHLLIHTGKRHFGCDICGQKFTQKSGLLSHRKKHPGEHPPLPMVRLDNALREFNTK
ncbi:zinc finger protein 271-like isoform X10 [Leptopilina boulardi]|uniref:zinc finger protein 271-like isoform X10 n=1 Tax=Leptopilina boulardi TaxID=63433 RepID=UPI0021F5DB6F|nr:zinc finger protein 271-like isoform X10 [Leptopilina boulardi]